MTEADNLEGEIDSTYARIETRAHEIKSALEEIVLAWRGGFFTSSENYTFEEYQALLAPWAGYSIFQRNLYSVYLDVLSQRPEMLINQQLNAALDLKKQYDEFKNNSEVEPNISSAKFLTIFQELTKIESNCGSIWGKLEQNLSIVRKECRRAIDFAQGYCKSALFAIQLRINKDANNFSSFLASSNKAIEEQKNCERLFLESEFMRANKKLLKHYTKIEKLLKKVERKRKKLEQQESLIKKDQQSLNALIEASQDFGSQWKSWMVQPSRTTLQTEAEYLLFEGRELEEQIRVNITYLGLDQDLKVLEKEWECVYKLLSPVCGETRMKNLVERIRLHQEKHPISGMNLLVHYILEDVKGKSLLNVGDRDPDGNIVIEQSQFQMLKSFMVEYSVGTKLSAYSFNGRSLAQQIWYDSLYKYMDDVINHPAAVKDEAHYFAYAERLFEAEKALAQPGNANNNFTPKTDVEKVKAIVELLCVWSEATEKLHKTIAPGLQRLLIEAVSVLSQGAKPAESKDSEAFRAFSAKQILDLFKETSVKDIEQGLLRTTLTRVDLALDTYSRTTFFRRKDTQTLEEAFKRICRAQ